MSEPEPEVMKSSSRNYIQKQENELANKLVKY